MKAVVTAVLALGIGLAAPTAGHAAAVPATPGTAQGAVGVLETLQLAQYKPEVGGRTVVVPRGGAAPRGGPVVRGGRVGVVGPGGPRVVGPHVVGPGPRVVVPGARVVVPGPRVYGRAAFVRGYRPWYRRPYFGTIVGGVALGTILTVAAVGVAPEYAPAEGLCWNWADPSMTTGYWDYCY